MPLTHARIGVLLGGQSAEREISLRSGQAVHAALLRLGYDAVTLDVDASLAERLRDQKVEVAFLALHGPGGEDGTVQGLLEMLGIPFTGSGVRASAIAMHKHATKAVLAYHGLPVARGTLLARSDAATLRRRGAPKGMKWPVVVKPASQGSTFGVSIVRRPSEWAPALQLAFQFDGEAVVEDYIPGHEVTVSVLEEPEGPIALPSIEIVTPEGFYDFTAKYEKGRTQYLCPAPLATRVRNRVEALAVECYGILGCRGAVRVDFRVTDRGRAYVLEVNTVPGMTETSLLPMAAAKAGIEYDALAERMLLSALRRMQRA